MNQTDAYDIIMAGHNVFLTGEWKPLKGFE